MRRNAFGIAALALGAAFLLTEVPTAEASPKPLGAATQASYKNNGAATQTVIKKKVKR